MVTPLKDKSITIALAGNPNSGKTSIFNGLTGARQKVGNFAGVTVEKREGRKVFNGYDLNIVDLPGTYSLTAQSLDEKVARDFLLNESPDIVINVIDSGCLERSLYLTTQLIAMGLDVIIDLNMWDELEKSGDAIDTDTLSVLLGTPIVTSVASRGKGINKLLDAVIELHENRQATHHHPPVSYGPLLDDMIRDISDEIEKSGLDLDGANSRWLAVKFIERDEQIGALYQDTLKQYKSLEDKIDKAVQHIKVTTSSDPEFAIEEGRMGFVAGVVREVAKKKSFNRMWLSTQIDNFLTHPLLGYPLFLIFMWLIFYATFTLGEYPQMWFETGISQLQLLLTSILPHGPVVDLVVEGIVGGVGSVIVFLPNIVILFLGISLLEDSGYMARAAFLTDKPMHFLGLHGKSFIPMLMGFGCTVPAIMATRTLESPRDRILTTLLLPMVSCSAKLPVYILIAGTFFEKRAGHVVFSMYILGIVFAIIVARILQRTMVKTESIPFVMELPPYRWPTLKSVVIHMWEKSKLYLKKMSGVILIASVILWALGYFPKSEKLTAQYDQKIETLKQQTPLDVQKLDSLIKEKRAAELEYSFIGRIGQGVEPVFKPLGFNWQMSVALFTGFAAKEVVVSTLGVLYQVEPSDEPTTSLSEKLKNSEITPLAAYTFLVFILLYTACIASVVAIKREIGAKWMTFSIVFQTAIAWIVSFVIYNAGMLMGL